MSPTEEILTPTILPPVLREDSRKSDRRLVGRWGGSRRLKENPPDDEAYWSFT